MQIATRCISISIGAHETSSNRFCNYMKRSVEILHDLIQNNDAEIIPVLSFANFARSLAFMCIFHHPKGYHPMESNLSDTAPWINIIHNKNKYLLKHPDTLQCHGVHSEVVRSEISQLENALRAMKDPERSKKYFGVAAEICIGLGRLIFSRGSDGLSTFLRGLGRGGRMLIEDKFQEDAFQLFNLTAWVELEFKKLERSIEELIEPREKGKASKLGPSGHKCFEEVKRHLSAVQSCALHENMPLDVGICFTMCLRELALGDSRPGTGHLSAPSPRIVRMPRDLSLWILEGGGGVGNEESGFMGIKGLAAFGHQKSSFHADSQGNCSQLFKCTQRAIQMRDLAKFIWEQLQESKDLSLSRLVSEVQRLTEEELEEKMENLLKMADDIVEGQAVKSREVDFKILVPQPSRQIFEDSEMNTEVEELDSKGQTLLATLMNFAECMCENQEICSKNETEQTDRIRQLSEDFFHELLSLLKKMLEKKGISGPSSGSVLDTVFREFERIIQGTITVTENGLSNLKRFIDIAELTNDLLKQSLKFIDSAIKTCKIISRVLCSGSGPVHLSIIISWIIKTMTTLKEKVNAMESGLQKLSRETKELKTKFSESIQVMRKLDLRLQGIRHSKLNRKAVFHGILQELNQNITQKSLSKLLMDFLKLTSMGYQGACLLRRRAQECRCAFSVLLGQPVSVQSPTTLCSEMYFPKCTENGDLVYEQPVQKPSKILKMFRCSPAAADTGESINQWEWRVVQVEPCNDDDDAAPDAKTCTFDKNSPLCHRFFYNLADVTWIDGCLCSAIDLDINLQTFSWQDQNDCLQELLAVGTEMRSEISFLINKQDLVNLGDVWQDDNSLPRELKDELEGASWLCSVLRQTKVSQNDTWRIRYLAINLLHQMISLSHFGKSEAKGNAMQRDIIEALARKAEAHLKQRRMVEPHVHVQWCLKHSRFAFNMMSYRMTPRRPDQKRLNGQKIPNTNAIVSETLKQMISAQEKQSRTQDIILEEIREGIKEIVCSRRDELSKEILKLKNIFQDLKTKIKREENSESKSPGEQNWDNLVAMDNNLVKLVVCFEVAAELFQLGKSEAFSNPSTSRAYNEDLKKLSLDLHQLKITKDEILNEPKDSKAETIISCLGKMHDIMGSLPSKEHLDGKLAGLDSSLAKIQSSVNQSLSDIKDWLAHIQEKVTSLENNRVSDLIGSNQSEDTRQISEISAKLAELGQSLKSMAQTQAEHSQGSSRVDPSFDSVFEHMRDVIGSWPSKEQLDLKLDGLDSSLAKIQSSVDHALHELQRRDSDLDSKPDIGSLLMQIQEKVASLESSRTADSARIQEIVKQGLSDMMKIELEKEQENQSLQRTVSSEEISILDSLREDIDTLKLLQKVQKEISEKLEAFFKNEFSNAGQDKNFDDLRRSLEQQNTEIVRIRDCVVKMSSIEAAEIFKNQIVDEIKIEVHKASALEMSKVIEGLNLINIKTQIEDVESTVKMQACCIKSLDDTSQVIQERLTELRQNVDCSFDSMHVELKSFGHDVRENLKLGNQLVDSIPSSLSILKDANHQLQADMQTQYSDSVSRIRTELASDNDKLTSKMAQNVSEIIEIMSKTIKDQVQLVLIDQQRHLTEMDQCVRSLLAMAQVISSAKEQDRSIQLSQLQDAKEAIITDMRQLLHTLEHQISGTHENLTGTLKEIGSGITSGLQLHPRVEDLLLNLQAEQKLQTRLLSYIGPGSDDGLFAKLELLSSQMQQLRDLILPLNLPDMLADQRQQLRDMIASLNLPMLLNESSLQRSLNETRKRWNRDLKAVRLIQSDYNLTRNTLDARGIENDIKSMHLVAERTIKAALQKILPDLSASLAEHSTALQDIATQALGRALKIIISRTTAYPLHELNLETVQEPNERKVDSESDSIQANHVTAAALDALAATVDATPIRRRRNVSNQYI